MNIVFSVIGENTCFERWTEGVNVRDDLNFILKKYNSEPFQYEFGGIYNKKVRV